jgi:sulfur-oxidizing protein SoxY
MGKSRAIMKKAELMAPSLLTRRETLAGLGAGFLLIATSPLKSFAADADTAAAIKQEFGDVKPKAGRVTLKLPPLAESGNSVPLTCTVDSPMSETDYIKRVVVFANRNPRPLIASLFFTPASGKAAVSTNMRLSGTQSVIAIAEMADKSLWQAQVQVVVTVGACDTLQSRY